jgi:hypothetical protein
MNKNKTSHDMCVECIHSKVCSISNNFHKVFGDALRLQDDSEDGYDRKNPESFNFLVTVECKHYKKEVANSRSTDLTFVE